MKKFFVFASIIAAVAMFASCEKKGDAPKARFDYAIEDMTVTFTNMSKEAETYAWEFGDGQTSTEKDPVHTYAAAGTYTVKLTAKNKAGENSTEQSIVLEKKAWSVKIDGNFEDWGKVPSDVLATAVADENSKYEAFYGMAFCSDADYIYFYLEFSSETGKYINDQTGEEFDGFVVDYMNIYLNLDDDATTGSNSYLWDASAAEFLIQGSAYALTESGLFFFNNPDQTAWGWEEAGVTGIIAEASDVVAVGDGHLAMEGKIMRAMFPQTPKVCKVGVYTSDSGWAETGVLPQITIDDQGAEVPSPLLEVKLN
ncbi:MAG: PKD domain-containing protein [Paludibacteraceae bacterium]|nr:PKD domain-containing protein [Paludibacteraceae bacterium]